MMEYTYDELNALMTAMDEMPRADITSEHVAELSKMMKCIVLPRFTGEEETELLSLFFASVLQLIANGARDASSVATAALSIMVTDDYTMSDILTAL